MDEFVIGIIGRSHGVKGLVKVKSLSGETDHFHNLSSVTVSKGKLKRVLNVENISVNAGGTLLCKFAGIDTPEEIRKYTGWEISVPRSLGAPLKEGEYYISDLKGCRLVGENDTYGKIHDIVDGPGGLLVDIRREKGSYLIPYTEQYFGKVNIERKEVQFLAPWVLE